MYRQYRNDVDGGGVIGDGVAAAAATAAATAIKGDHSK